MIRIFFVFVLGLSALCGAARERRSRIAWDVPTCVRLFAHGNYSRMIETRSGELIAVTDGGGVWLARSCDGGRTWSEQRLVVPNTPTHDMAVPDLMECRDGSLLLCYNPRAAHDNADPARRFGIRVRRSEDGGRTWSDEIFVHDAGHRFGDGCWDPSAVQLPDGEIRLFFADEGEFPRSDEQSIGMCRSRDGGRTWSAAERAAFRPGFRDGMPVPGLLEERRRVLVAIEDNGYSHHMNHFQPTVLRMPWRRCRTAIGARSRRRTYPFVRRMEAAATAGAPYLRRAATGEWLLSWQGNAGRRQPLLADGFKPGEVGALRMQVAMGDRSGRNFGCVSAPFDGFARPGADPAERLHDYYGNWNALCATRDGGVWALSATDRFGSHACMAVKGWLLHDFAPRRCAGDPFPAEEALAAPDLAVAPRADAGLYLRTAADDRQLYLHVRIVCGDSIRSGIEAEIDFGQRFRVRIGESEAVCMRAGYDAPCQTAAVRPTDDGFVAEAAIDRWRLRRCGVRGRTPVQATLRVPQGDSVRTYRIVDTDEHPRSWLRIDL